MAKLVYKVSLAPDLDTNIVQRELTVNLGDGSPIVIASLVDGGEIKVPEGSTPSLTVVAINDHGLRSDPSLPFVFTADSRPRTPGAVLGVSFVRVEADEEIPAAA